MLLLAYILMVSAFHTVSSSIVTTDLDNSHRVVDVQTPNIQLTYFDAKGSAEVSRLLMKIGNLDFVDHRLPIPTTAIRHDKVSEYGALRKSGRFNINMDRVPVLVINDDLAIGQSRAIERYIAAKCKLFGGNEEERAMIDCISENVRDIKEKYAEIRRSELRTCEFSDTKVSSWFQSETGLQEWLTKLEKSLPPASDSSDFAVGSELSLADVSIWHLLRDYFHEHQPEVLKVEERALCGRLSRIAQKVSEHSAVKKWLTDRPATLF